MSERLSFREIVRDGVRVALTSAITSGILSGAVLLYGEWQRRAEARARFALVGSELQMRMVLMRTAAGLIPDDPAACARVMDEMGGSRSGVAQGGSLRQLAVEHALLSGGVSRAFTARVLEFETRLLVMPRPRCAEEVGATRTQLQTLVGGLEQGWEPARSATFAGPVR